MDCELCDLGSSPGFTTFVFHPFPFFILPIVHLSTSHRHIGLGLIRANINLKYVFGSVIFGAGMGRDDGHYCDVLSSGVNLSLVEGSWAAFIPSAGQTKHASCQ